MSSATSSSASPYGDGGAARGSRGPVAGAYPEQVIGAYVVGETVGRGSFGKVKRGRHLHTGEPVAIKILNRQKLKSANMDKKIHREIEILQLFSHPNICRLYEVISTPTDMYLIMEFIEGGELYDYIVQKGRVREAEARYIFQQIVCAIEYCHHFRVVHRDLKPENILLGPGLQVKLIDFGLSNIMKDGEFLTTSCGSPNYAAPEVISGKLYFGPEVDVWSCGVILYALLCGCLPFDEDSIPLLFSKIKKAKYAIPATMPGEPRALIQQILLVDPLVRLTIPQIRDNAWFNQRLPMRLSYNESLFAVQEDRIISVLASETAKKLSMREKDVRRELERGSGAAYVAYNILLDARRKREIAAEVRELGVASDDVTSSSSPGGPSVASPGSPAPSLTQQQSLSGGGSAAQTAFEPKATERELNMGLMLSPSPAMESLLEHGDATANRQSYNTGTFVPASEQLDSLAPSTPPFPSVADGGMGLRTPKSLGGFSMKRRVGSPPRPSANSLHSPGSYRGGASATSLRNTGLSTSAASQLGASLTDQPRVGSVARKHAMYTTEEEQFLVQNNYGWRVGLMTDWHAEKAFQCVYGVLRSYKMEWKVLSPFHVMARTTRATWTVMDEQDRGDALDAPRAASASAPIPIGGAEGAAGAGSSASIPIGIAGAGGHNRTDRHSPFGRGQYFGSLMPDLDETSSDGHRSPSDSQLLRPSSRPADLRSAVSVETALPPSVPPAQESIISLHLFRIHERHDKGFLVDFSVRRGCLSAMDLVNRLSNELIRRCQ